MSGHKKILRYLIGLTSLLFSLGGYAANEVNVYAWSNYLPTSVIKKFEKETGIKVNLSEYDSNETLYAKLRADPNIGYDIILPSSYFVDRMRQESMLHTIDKSQLSHLKYLTHALLNKAFDPHNQYSLPFLWGTTGILVDRRYWNPKTVQRWSSLWQKRFHSQLLLLDDPREVFSMALITLGYSVNDTSPIHIRQAYEKLKQLMPNVRVFNSDAITNIYADGDVTVGMSWAGESWIAKQTNPHLIYIYPQDGFAIWIDCIAIPKQAPHLQNAYKFINFILRPDIAKILAIKNGYSTPNWAAIQKMSPTLQHNPIINPNPKVLEKGQYQLYIGPATQIVQHYLDLLKLGS